MKRVLSQLKYAILLIALALAAVAISAQAPEIAEHPGGDIPRTSLLQTADLARTLMAPGTAGADKPLILQVGSRILFAEAHIPGSEYAGPGGSDSGLAALRTRLQDVSADRPILLYCGCCPWNKCPNIRAAYWELRRLGFHHVQALYIPQDFGTDWVNHDYPVAKGAK